MLRKNVLVLVIAAVVAVLFMAVGIQLILPKAPVDDMPSSSQPIVSTSIVDERVTFTATVLQVYEKSVLVEPVAGSWELRSADQIDVSLSVRDNVPVPQMKAGDIIEIVYDGLIQETYPAGIPDVYAIYMKQLASATATKTTTTTAKSTTTTTIENPVTITLKPTTFEAPSADKGAYPLTVKTGDAVTRTKISRADWGLDYDVYYIGIDSAEVTIDGKTTDLIAAVEDGALTFEQLLQDAAALAREKKIYSAQYKDGGSWLYRYDDYAILKMNRLDGDRTLYIGTNLLTASLISKQSLTTSATIIDDVSAVSKNIPFMVGSAVRVLEAPFQDNFAGALIESETQFDAIQWEGNTALGRYTESYFTDKALIMLEITLTSGSFELRIDDVWVNGDTLTARYTIICPNPATADMAYWRVLLEVSRNDVETIRHITGEQNKVTRPSAR